MILYWPLNLNIIQYYCITHCLSCNLIHIDFMWIRSVMWNWFSIIKKLRMASILSPLMEASYLNLELWLMKQKVLIMLASFAKESFFSAFCSLSLLSHSPGLRSFILSLILSLFNFYSDTNAASSLQAYQKDLKKAKLVDDLNDKIAYRPGVIELVERNILPATEPMQEALKGITSMNCSENLPDAIHLGHR